MVYAVTVYANSPADAWQGLVLWHVFGTTRLVRLEDWPVSPSELLGFSLQPDGFFDRSPCIGPVGDPVPATPASAATTPVASTAMTAGPAGEDELRSKL